MKRLAYEEEMRKLRKPKKIVDKRKIEMTVDVNLKDKGK